MTQKDVKGERVKNEIAEFCKLLIPAAIFITGGSWMSDTFKSLLPPGSGSTGYSFCSSVIWFLVSFGIWTGGAWWLYRLRKKFLPISTLYEGAKVETHKVLITLVSTSSKDVTFDWSSRGLTLKFNKDDTTAALTGGKDKLDDDITSIGKAADRWNWQQLMRAIKPHVLTLERVVLIGSKEQVIGSKEQVIGSKEQADRAAKAENGCTLDNCGKLLKLYAADATFSSQPPVDFESLDEVREVIINAIRSLRNEGYKESDIIIDVTGGKKTTSIAAALATLYHDHVEFQYVPESGKEAKAYNVITVSPINLAE